MAVASEALAAAIAESFRKMFIVLLLVGGTRTASAFMFRPLNLNALQHGCQDRQFR
jgi:hypothetical protein